MTNFQLFVLGSNYVFKQHKFVFTFMLQLFFFCLFCSFYSLCFHQISVFTKYVRKMLLLPLARLAIDFVWTNCDVFHVCSKSYCSAASHLGLNILHKIWNRNIHSCHCEDFDWDFYHDFYQILSSCLYSFFCTCFCFYLLIKLISMKYNNEWKIFNMLYCIWIKILYLTIAI